jgi:hypothetical protein
MSLPSRKLAYHVVIVNVGIDKKAYDIRVSSDGMMFTKMLAKI